MITQFLTIRMDKSLESKKLYALNEEKNLERKLLLLTDYVDCLENKVLELCKTKEEVLKDRKKNNSALKNSEGNKEILILEIVELEKELKKKKDELVNFKSELKQLIQSEKQLKAKEDAHTNDIVNLEKEIKHAHEILNVTTFRKECREFIYRPTTIKDPMDILKQEIENVEAMASENGFSSGKSNLLISSFTKSQSQTIPSTSCPGYYSSGGGKSLSYKPPISPSAIKSLVVGQLLNDEALNFLLKETTKMESKNYAIASCQWLSKKRNIKYNETECLLTKPNILAPMNTQRGTHWGLIHVNETNKSIYWYDSLHLTGEDEMNKVESDLNYYKFSKGMPIFTYQKENISQIPFQEDNNSCGVYTLFFAKHIVCKKSMNFDQQKIDLYRNRTVFKLLKGKEPGAGSLIDGKDFLSLLDSEIQKTENR